ncbi:hypothetical protein M409DRAFT_56088 [Zasmidium cellare ATCC 36951]|uniref:F-box domain-containing protein n=1 Tax=Zasmidium cellare ATCC 36951 TaxID=1080233 RepID=A0A6A6CEY2_ZASCE|nr:uncharacterized protein M409DRAFT_56088 [Zasmidium cellare ATCC 36951]KAF2165213.1 hypothetical protein M409DRAFT_56088 [Zasmidium cellare ATCC 36951]
MFESVICANPPRGRWRSHAVSDILNSATRVFNIPELLELILLSLPHDTIHQEITSIRTILLARTTTRTWHNLILDSPPIRKTLYLPTPTSAADRLTWSEKHSFPPADPNPWIPNLLLHQRSWGSAYPFDTFTTTTTTPSDIHPTTPKHWTFSFEISRAQYTRLPAPGPWRDMLATSPPFTHFWYTRCFYELGSGRAPFVTHLDYDAGVPKCEQRLRRGCAEGVTLGMICDAVGDLFEGDPRARFAMVESLRVKGEGDEGEEGPRTKAFVPGSSAERAVGWARGHWGD